MYLEKATTSDSSSSRQRNLPADTSLLQCKCRSKTAKSTIEATARATQLRRPANIIRRQEVRIGAESSNQRSSSPSCSWKTLGNQSTWRTRLDLEAGQATRAYCRQMPTALFKRPMRTWKSWPILRRSSSEKATLSSCFRLRRILKSTEDSLASRGGLI